MNRKDCAQFFTNKRKTLQTLKSSSNLQNYFFEKFYFFKNESKIEIDFINKEVNYIKTKLNYTSGNYIIAS